MDCIGGPADHINLRISHSGSRARYKGDARNYGLKDPSVYVAFWPPISGHPGSCKVSEVDGGWKVSNLLKPLQALTLPYNTRFTRNLVMRLG